MPSLKYTTISNETFAKTLSRYASTVPEKLRELDSLRYTTLPATLAARAAKDDAHLTKDEVAQLVEWKLKHGTFRPKLLQLVQSNAAADVEQATREAFSTISKSRDVSSALKVLVRLKGIGPATASLLLSAHAPASVPFFSDELFRWVMWDAPGSLGGWKRGIKYVAKEYETVVGRVEEVRRRLGVDAVDVERVAWVLGRKDVDVGGADGEGVQTESDNKEAKRKAKSSSIRGSAEESVETKGAKKGVKRKVSETKEAVEGLRRSNRRRTAA